MIKASAVVLAVGEISPEGSQLYIMGIHSVFFFSFKAFCMYYKSFIYTFL